ncbi:MAG: XdhC family protein [Anaerovoracaceae bacterium]
MRKLFKILKEQMEAGNSITMVSVTGSSGSTPRGAGARMLVGKEGRIYGTIGGGAVEYLCQQKAQEVLETKKSFNESYRLKPNQVQDLGMICGGDVDCYFQYISNDDEKVKALVEHGLALFADEEDAWLITDITEGQSSQMGIYSKAFGTFGIEVSEEITNDLQSKPYRIEVEGKKYYIEQINETGKVYIFGGGHVAQELVPTLARIKFRCLILEDREDFAKKELFDGVIETRIVDMLNLSDVCVEITKNDYICIMTRGHKDDYEIQRQVLKTPARYIGVIGSKRKTAKVFEKLRADGYNDNDLCRITAPIGLPILAETPAEIAVSIAGELINERAKEK